MTAMSPSMVAPQKPSYKLRPNDQIDAELTALPLAGFARENIPIEIVYEDEDLVVVNKPAGMVVHPATGVASGTLANALAFHFQKLSSGSGAARPGIVHRLDKDTSGTFGRSEDRNHARRSRKSISRARSVQVVHRVGAWATGKGPRRNRPTDRS
jgi:23S rRNA pseudouridine1911/1915/1917 synthase